MRRWIAVGALVATISVVGAGFAIAGAGEGDRPLTGGSLDRATEAALAHTGGGTVVETEVGDDGAAYGVEVRLDDGTVVEVSLDAGFRVMGQETDDDGSGEEGRDDD